MNEQTNTNDRTQNMFDVNTKWLMLLNRATVKLQAPIKREAKILFK